MVNYALNAGAGAIVRPHVQNAQQAEEFVRLARFPPQGSRSFPPHALIGSQYDTREGETIFDVWNNNIAVICQIEDVEGVRNIEAICAVPGGTLP
jgi:4-hydroxy-2-oxoheptanedioate aldolase